MEILIFAILLGLIPAAIAQKKGRIFLGWWLFGSLLFIVALPTALVVGPNPDTMRECPACRGWSNAEAIRCRHCGQALSGGRAKTPQVNLGRISPEAAAWWRAQHTPEIDTKVCPMCAETVKAAAKICRFCGHAFFDDVAHQATTTRGQSP